MNSLGERWLRVYQPAPRARIRLVCFPHAGGNAAFYRSWCPLLPPSVELVAVSYPGRLDRTDEPCISDMSTMVSVVTEALLPGLSRPTAFFGHSMGAAIAHEVARVVELRFGLSVPWLFVSGRQPPQHHRRVAVDVEDDEALWSELRRLGGTEQVALDSPAIRDMAIRAVRGDYRLVDRYSPTAGPPLGCPVTALVGESDDDVPLAEVDGWRQHTSGVFDVETFSGGHFYLIPQRDAVVKQVLARLVTAE